jgi:CheY-like chemotaxis protein/signal transduction histidine kinase/HAMP domain-containing protein
MRSGDFSVRLPGDWIGLEGKIADTFNDIVAANQQMARELQRVGLVVGKEGKTRERAHFARSGGAWGEMEVSVNTLVDDLLRPTTEVTGAIAAVAQGDLRQTVRLDVDGRPLEGEFLRSAMIVNTMIQQLGVFASEVTRVAREVGSEGKLGGQAAVPGVAGTWKDLTDSVNAMAGNLTAQVRNIAEVTTAVARGDLSRKITVNVSGEILELKETINTMVDQLNAFAGEVTRVAREVGTEGKLGGQAQVPGIAGTWKDLTDNVNSMANNLTAQVRNIAEVTTAVALGDLSRKITVDVKGEILLLKETINTMVDQLNAFAGEVTRVAREVGTEGKLGGQAAVPGVAGTWKDLTDSVNFMAGNLTAQVRNIAEVATAIAGGDLSRKITVNVSGEILELKETINTMVDQLNAFAAEVTRVAREVGTEGKLGGQAAVPGVAGTWKDLTDNVNVMANNLTEQVRGIVKVVTAVANGDLDQKLTVNAKGEVAALAETINNMTGTLATFADQVTTVAREVGVEGRLGGQANVPGASGTWKDLTGNVNLLAANLTNQVRAIAEVATAVTQGDLTRSIQVEASGEVAELSDNINTMIDNLRLTTDRNTEQDWLKTNLARFTSMLQGQRDLTTVGRMLLSELTSLVNAQQGVIYQVETEETPGLSLLSAYADSGADGHQERLRFGEGLLGQCAIEKRSMLITDLPPQTAPIRSSLFEAVPRNVVVLPVLFEDQVKAVIELASLSEFTASHLAFLEQLTASIGIVLNSIEATMQTEGLLKQSQQLAAELQTQQRELQQTNDQLEQKAQQLAERNVEVERKNQEIEQARRALEEKAAELALTSKYKSEFMANMSHELRTPLNSILILGQQLGDNPEGNLSPKQVEFARTIHGAGTDLLNLISDILDLSKIESGTVSVDAEEIGITSLLEMVARPFRHEADNRRLTFETQVDAHLSPSIVTDAKRLQQILKNLLSNAFKFTERGGVHLSVYPAKSGWSADHPMLKGTASVVAFEVSDTGIGIPPDKQKLIFEPFQQAEASTNRRFGGTGLGLAISRELATLLGGEIQLRSTPEVGSTFTLYVPQTYVGSPLLGDIIGETSAESANLRADRDEISIARWSRPLKVARITERLTDFAPLLDDRDVVQPDDAVLLVVEDDPYYGRVLVDLARDKGFKVVAATRGLDALALARQFRPTAVSLDVFLPDMLGWTVLNQLKQDPTFRHIPVQIITVDEDRQHGLARGAFSFLTKPTTTEGLELALDRIKDYATSHRKRLLVVEDNDAERLSITELLGYDDIEIVTVGSGAEALDALHGDPFDCIVLDLRLPDMSGFEVLEHIRDDETLRDIPVVVFTGKQLTAEEDARLHTLARSVVVKGVESPERLLDETALFLHRVVADLPLEKQRLLNRLHSSDDDLVGTKVLVVDDDVRNIFALSSVLERRGMIVLTAGTGREAIETLETTPNLAIVLMDIMMPEMDGYETMQVIRRNPALQRLPIIALTAKAMKGDREKCLEAGASDYLAKPVNTEQLLSALRMWLHR